MPEDVPACQFALRPKGTARLLEIAPLVRSVQHGERMLTVAFAPDQLEVLAYVAAERPCCPDITWQLTGPHADMLHSHDTPGRIAILAEMHRMAQSAVGEQQ